MKSQKGITLTSLVIYVGISTVIISMVGLVTSFFLNNIYDIKQQDTNITEFNKFNMFFINDVKQNSDVTVGENKITFEDGTEYVYNEEEKAIYRNDTKITKNVTSFSFNVGTYKIEDTKEKKLITVNIYLGDSFAQIIEYVLRYW